MMSEIDEAIARYARSHKDAEDNPRLMIESRGAAASLCEIKMKRLMAAEAAMRAMRGRLGLPRPLLDFLEADDDKGCTSCWMSSKRRGNHPECEAKITRWFAARAALVEHGLAIKEDKP
jgi:hypothetical protein